LEARCDQAAFDLVAQAGDDAEKHVLRHACRIAREKFIAITLVFANQGFELFGLGAEEAFLDTFEFDLAEVFDFNAEFLVPADEGAFGDGEFLGDTVEAPAFGRGVRRICLWFPECA
jgi:hypothetical protein